MKALRDKAQEVSGKGWSAKGGKGWERREQGGGV